jgi:tRNA(adenine34) deaminase
MGQAHFGGGVAKSAIVTMIHVSHTHRSFMTQNSPEQSSIDARFMARALELARAAEAAGEVPVGAVIVKEGAIVAEGWNRPISAHDPTAHAEIVAMRAAAQTLQSYRLLDTTLYVTLEPCAMCAGAMVHARVKRLVFAALDPRAGAAGSVFNIVQHAALNHRLEITGGVMAEECSAELRKFFIARR